MPASTTWMRGLFWAMDDSSKMARIHRSEPRAPPDCQPRMVPVRAPTISQVGKQKTVWMRRQLPLLGVAGFEFCLAQRTSYNDCAAIATAMRIRNRAISTNLKLRNQEKVTTNALPTPINSRRACTLRTKKAVFLSVFPHIGGRYQMRNKTPN